MSAPLVIQGKRPGAKRHIAAHEPSGYGVRVLCGKSWREGDYLFFQGANFFPTCARCRKLVVS